MNQQQKKLGNRGTLIFLALISAFPPLSTDLYLPALPQMVEVLNTTPAKVNLTLSLFFIFYAAGLLFWGPLSEKFGRKPILLIGLSGYIISSILCAISINVELLIVSRILQAFASSAITVVATAIVKDLYDGREREKIMATVMSLVIIAPMIAPMLGAFLLKITSWRMVFIVLSGFGGIATIASLLFEETLKNKYSGPVFSSWGRLLVVLKNPQFSSLLGIFSMVPMAMMGYLAASSFIYISHFQLSEQHFSYFFSFNALFAMAGPTLYIRISKYCSAYRIISVCFVVLICCGIVVFSLGSISPWIFAIAVAPATLAVITLRIPAINLMLNQQNQDTGSASALINFSSMTMGSLGMFLVSLNPRYLIESLGIIQLSVGLVGGCLWFFINHQSTISYKAVEE